MTNKLKQEAREELWRLTAGMTSKGKDHVVDCALLFIDKALEARDKEFEEMIKSQKETEKQLHTPNCQRGTCKNNHFFCSYSDEQRGNNSAMKTLLQALKDKKTV